MHPPSMRLVLVEVGARQPERRHFYLHEVQASIYNPDAHFVVDKVLARRRGAGNQKEVLVRFLDYHGLFAPIYNCYMMHYYQQNIICRPQCNDVDQ